MAPPRLFSLVAMITIIAIIMISTPTVTAQTKKILLIAPSNDPNRKEHERFRRMLKVNADSFEVLETFVQGKDFTPTLVFDPKKYDAIIIAWNQQFGRSDLSTFAQEQIINATKYFGTGLLLNEWVSFDATANKFFQKFLREKYILIGREGGSFAVQTMKMGDALKTGTQKIIAGTGLTLGQFSVPRGGITIGAPNSESYVAVLSSVSESPLAACRTIPGLGTPAVEGRVSHFAYSGEYFGFDPYSSQKLQTLWLNALGWMTHDTDSAAKTYNIDPTASIDDMSDPSGLPPEETEPPVEIHVPGGLGSDDPNVCNDTCNPIPKADIKDGICSHVDVPVACKKVWLIDGVYYNATFFQMSLAADAFYKSQMRTVAADSKATCAEPLRNFACSKIFRKCVPNEKYLYKICRGTCWEMRRACRIELDCDSPVDFYDNKIGESLGQTLWGPPTLCTGFSSGVASLKPSLLVILLLIAAFLGL